MPPIGFRSRCCLFIALAISTLLGCSHSKVPPSAPPVRVVDLEGKSVDLLQQERGRISVVIFTRTDCPISNRFAPEIRRLDETYRPRGVDFFLIYVDPHEDPAAIRRHLSEYQYACTGLRDPEHVLVAYCHATTTPEAVVFNRDGTIAYQGRISDQYVELGTAKPQAARHDLAEAIESTLLGRPVAVARTTPVGCSIADLKD
jgi:hypothetical protein